MTAELWLEKPCGHEPNDEAHETRCHTHNRPECERNNCEGWLGSHSHCDGGCRDGGGACIVGRECGGTIRVRLDPDKVVFKMWDSHNQQYSITVQDAIDALTKEDSDE